MKWKLFGWLVRNWSCKPKVNNIYFYMKKVWIFQFVNSISERERNVYWPFWWFLHIFNIFGSLNDRSWKIKQKIRFRGKRNRMIHDLDLSRFFLIFDAAACWCFRKLKLWISVLDRTFIFRTCAHPNISHIHTIRSTVTDTLHDGAICINFDI